MSETTPRAEGAAPYALTIRRILECPIAFDPAQEIVYRGLRRHTYAELRARVHRLAGALAALGVRRGDTVAVLDW
ncbi:MAG TPA: AMP-binding protein, partial [Anaeromyxobacter sp.]|nr:AMP-binding protein [Anaeromyxobacter sp.]